MEDKPKKNCVFTKSVFKKVCSKKCVRKSSVYLVSRWVYCCYLECDVGGRIDESG